MASPAHETDRPIPTLRQWLRTLAPHSFIALVYALTHTLGLLNRGLFWDDWVFWQQDKALVAQISRDMGSTWPTTINHLIFYSDAGITFARLLSYAALLCAALLLFGILRRLSPLSDNIAMWSAVIFVLYPGYTARQALVMVGYALCLALFLAAVWLLVRYAPSPGIPVRVVSALLFLLSFQTRSLLVMCALLPVVLLMVDPPEAPGVRPLVKKLFSYSEQFALPFIFWAVTRVWFQPRGLYAGYNQLGAEKIEVLPTLWWGVVHSTPLSVIWARVTPDLSALATTAVLLIPLLLLGWRRWSMRHDSGDLWRLDAGIALMVLAIVPYAAVGKIPHFEAFDSRHQLLVPIGWGLIIATIAKAHVRATRASSVAVGICLAVVLSSFAAVHLQSYLGYQREWLKQQALIEAFKTSPEIQGASTILFVDHTPEWNAGHRSESQHYEYNGMFAEAFGDQTRLGVDRAHYPHLPNAFSRGLAELEGNRYYKLGNWRRHAPDHVVTIREGKLDLSPSVTVLRLTILDWTDRERLRAELSRAIVLEAKPYE